MNPKHKSLSLIALTVALLSACRQDAITVQRVPKEAAPVMPMGAAGGEMPSAPAQTGATWSAPKNWKEKAVSQMRVGSFEVPTASDPVDVSIVPLAGDAGGDLANINRWRGQLGLPPVEESGLAAITHHQNVGPYNALVVEFFSTDPKPKRLLAAVIQHGGTTWFFKATGPGADVEKLKPEFLKFAGSLRFKHDE